jgi:hypothetical protein
MNKKEIRFPPFKPHSGRDREKTLYEIAEIDRKYGDSGASDFWVRGDGQKILLPNRGQNALLRTDERFIVLVAGRGYGKSMTGRAKIYHWLLEEDVDLIWYVTHFYKQAKDIAWLPLLKEVPSELIIKKNESDLTMDVRIGDKAKRIQLKGADQDPDALRGSRPQRVLLDEYGFMKESVWTDIIRPMLLTHHGKAMFVGSPSGLNHYYDLFCYGKAHPDWKCFLFYAADNPYNSMEEMEDARREYIGRNRYSQFLQEYMADFVDYGGLVWPMFEEEFHVIDDFAPVVGQYVFLRAIDWGYTHPCATLFAAIADGEITIFDEYWEDRHIIASEVAKNILGMHKLPFLINYGGHDFSRADSGSGTPTWEFFSKEGIYIRQWDSGPGSVQAGCNRVGELLHIDKNGKSRLHFTRKCKRTIYEVSRYRMDEAMTADEKRKRPEKPLKKEDDCADALRGLCVMRPEYLVPDMAITAAPGTDEYYRQMILLDAIAGRI